MSARWLPNINCVRAIVCPAVVFIAMNMDRGYQTDFWHHLARGREIAITGRVTNLTPLTFAAPDADAHALDANWLTQVSYYKLLQLGGQIAFENYRARLNRVFDVPSDRLYAPESETTSPN